MEAFLRSAGRTSLSKMFLCVCFRGEFWEHLSCSGAEFDHRLCKAAAGAAGPPVLQCTCDGSSTHEHEEQPGAAAASFLPLLWVPALPCPPCCWSSITAAALPQQVLESKIEQPQVAPGAFPDVTVLRTSPRLAFKARCSLQH